MVRVVWGAVIFLAVIGIEISAGRSLVLAFPTQFGRLVAVEEQLENWMMTFFSAQFDGNYAHARELDAHFTKHRTLTLVHIVPGFLFMVLGPFQFIRRIRSKRIWVHRLIGRVFVASGLVIGLSALVMSFRMPMTGANETAALALFALIFLFDLGKAFWHIRRREIAQHREWMIRAFAIGLAVATIRPIVGLFFATSGLTHLTFREFFGTACWIGFTLHLIAAEIWVNYTRPKVAALPEGLRQEIS